MSRELECYVCKGDLVRRKGVYVERANAMGMWQTATVCMRCFRELAANVSYGLDGEGKRRLVRRLSFRN